MSSFNIRYRFEFDTVHRTAILLEIDSESLELKHQAAQSAQHWTELAFNKCPNCPLDENTHTDCPVAENLVPLIDACGDMTSYDDVFVVVETPERTISKATTLQRGISSLLGLIMATSACPHTRFFRPMARFHLPFSTEEETVYRAVSMYLLFQYFNAKNGGAIDMDLHGMKEIYENLQLINRSMANRVRAASDQDAAVNAVVLLDLMAKGMPFSIEESLEEISYLFQ